MSDDWDEGSPGQLDRARERERIERRYVAALAALDAAAEPSPELTASASASDADHARLNQVWNRHAPARTDRSAAARIKTLIAELARMLPWRRRALNGALVAAVNRQAEVTRALIDATRHFQSHVIWYGQTVAAFAAAQRRGFGSAQDSEAMSAALSALSSDWLRHWDALQVREQRYGARMAALGKAYEDLREVVNLAQQSTMSLKRATETGAVVSAPAGGLVAEPAAADLDAFKYVAFEDRYRGSREDIRTRLAHYLPLFKGAANVADLGCGRGELLDLFREQGITARGIDLNAEMVEACRTRGLTADRADALSFLAAQPDDSLGGLIAIQVVEHLEPPYLMRLIETAHHKLKAGAPLVLETINAASWTAFFDSYIRDFTHVRPLHPDTLRYLVQVSGFPRAEIEYLSPIDPHDQLPQVRLPAPRHGEVPDPTVVDLVSALNAHAERLNAQIYGHRDYAIIARR